MSAELVSTTGLHSLATEILYEIASKLDGPDNRALRFMNHQINLVVEPLALVSLNISTVRRNLNSLLEMLDAYASKSTRASVHVRNVIVKCAIHQHGSYVQDVELLRTKFEATMEALPNVQNIKWFVNDIDPLQSSAKWIANYIAVRHINTFCLDFWPGMIGWPEFADFSSIANLKSFTFRGPSYRVVGPAIWAISNDCRNAIIVNSRLHLSHLEIDTRMSDPNDVVPRLEVLLPPVTQPLTALKHLSLYSVDPFLGATAIHLRNLKSLHLYSSPRWFSSLDNFRSFWNTLQAESIHLSRINMNLDDVEDGLLDFLSSYKGLSELILNDHPGWMSPFQVAARLPQRFFMEILPKISKGLDTLHVESRKDNHWCLSRANWEAFANCTSLTQLALSVITPKKSSPAEIEAEKFLIQDVTSRMPFLERMEILHVTPDQS